jgi:hypothetical protein
MFGIILGEVSVAGDAIEGWRGPDVGRGDIGISDMPEGNPTEVTRCEAIP